MILTESERAEKLRKTIRPRLRSVVRYDENYKVFIARCLETGSVATGDTAELAGEILSELLDDEVAFAIEHNNLSNLFSSPASPEVWLEWEER